VDPSAASTVLAPRSESKPCTVRPRGLLGSRTFAAFGEVIAQVIPGLLVGLEYLCMDDAGRPGHGSRSETASHSNRGPGCFAVSSLVFCFRSSSFALSNWLFDFDRPHATTPSCMSERQMSADDGQSENKKQSLSPRSPKKQSLSPRSPKVCHREARETKSVTAKPVATICQKHSRFLGQSEERTNRKSWQLGIE
jgi:hypothetical protein